MRIKIIIYLLLSLSLPMQLHAQTKRALVIGLGEHEDKAWNKINGDKDVPLVQAMLTKGKGDRYLDPPVRLVIKVQDMHTNTLRYSAPLSHCRFHAGYAKFGFYLSDALE